MKTQVESSIGLRLSIRPPDPTETKIRSFRNLEPGWFYGDGQRPAESTVAAAIWVHSLARDLGFDSTDAFPGVNGEIQVTIYDGEADYDFTFLPSGLISFSSEDAGAHKVRRKKLRPRTAIAILKNLSSSPVIQCTSIDYSRQSIGTENVTDSKILGSAHPMTVPVLQSFLKIASGNVEICHACV